MDKNCVTL